MSVVFVLLIRKWQGLSTVGGQFHHDKDIRAPGLVKEKDSPDQVAQRLYRGGWRRRHVHGWVRGCRGSGEPSQTPGLGREGLPGAVRVGGQPGRQAWIWKASERER